ncbi:MAG: type II and III secretion system protein family protein [Sphingomonadaceae bacterium]
MQSKTQIIARPLALAISLTLAFGGMAEAAKPKGKRWSNPAARNAPARPAAGVQRPVGEVYLSKGRSQLITLPAAIDEVFVTNDAVADVKVKSANQIYLLGKDKGETSFYVTGRDGKIIYSANIRVAQNINSIDDIMRQAMPESDITVVTSGQTMLLLGTAASPEDSAQAERIADSMMNPGINLADPAALRDIVVINRLRVATPMQVTLQVRIAEVNRSLIKEFNSSLRTLDSTSGFKFGITQGREGITLDGAGGGQINPIGGTLTTLGFLGRLFGLDIGTALDIGETQGFVATLASPSLTALSGQQANFLAGGQLPIPVRTPVPGGGFITTVEFKPYGVNLTFTPRVMADGRISLAVNPEVSDLDFSNSVTIDGATIPSLSTRSARTTVELGSGQSFVIGGLLRTINGSTLTKTPGIGDVPVLGALFRSNSYRRNETELIIVVTPYLVKPVSADKIVLPTDGFEAPTDVGRLLLNETYRGVSGKSRPMPTMAPPKTVAQPQIGAGLAVPEPQVPAKRAPVESGPATPGFSG